MIKLAFFFSLFCFSLTFFAEELPEYLKEGLIEGHSSTCKPVIKNQLIQQGIDPDDSTISSYCLCLGHKYFDKFKQNANLSELGFKDF